jgi:hypothetical protein
MRDLLFEDVPHGVFSTLSPRWRMLLNVAFLIQGQLLAQQEILRGTYSAWAQAQE